MNLRDIKVVAGFEIQRLLRSPHGVLFLAFFGTFYLWIAIELYQASESLGQLQMGNSLGMLEGAMFSVIGWFTDLEPEALQAVLTQHSPLLVVFFMAAIVVTPLFTMIGSCDQTASDIGSRHIRYLLLRCDRTSLYVGKVLGTILFVAAALGVSTLIIGLIALVAGGGSASFLDSLLYLVRIWLSLVLFSTPFIALMAFANAVTGHSFLALVMGIGTQFVLWMITAMGSFGSSGLKHASYAFPTKFKYHLLSDQSGDLLKVFLHISLFVVLFFVTGLVLFRRRDV